MTVYRQLNVWPIDGGALATTSDCYTILEGISENDHEADEEDNLAEDR
jgi:hypothetical protein